MKNKLLNILGIASFLTGIIFLLNSFSGLTGFVVFEGVGRTGSFVVGLIFVVGGIVLMTAAFDWNRCRINLVVREYETEELNPVQAALKINDTLYPHGIKITGVNYNKNWPTNESIKTEEGTVHVRLNDESKARDLAIALYEIALINDRKNANNCELEFGKFASSKHHREGLRKLIGEFEKKYRHDLNLAIKR